MQLSAFKKSIKENIPPSGGACLKALWYDGQDNWHEAHALVDSLEEKEAYWVHAYLHRKEGDLGNAGYWYSRAGKPRPSYPLGQEWEELVCYFLQKSK